jgi:predicted MFS family arabinose efflux permease
MVAAFLVYEGRIAHPLVPLRVFRERNLAGGSAIQSLLIVAMSGWFFFSSLYMEHVLGYSASATGAAFMPATVVIGVLSLGVCAKLMDVVGARAVLIAGLVLVVAGLSWWSQIPEDGGFAGHVLPGMVLMGLGAGLAFMPLITIAMSDTTRRDSGLASGLVNTSQQLGGALGLAVLASVSTGRTDSLVGAGTREAAASLSGYHLAFIIAAGAGLVAIVGTVAILRHTNREAHGDPHDPAVADAIEHHGMLF